MVQSMSSLITGLVIAFIYSWRLTLVIIGSMPLMAFAGSYQLKLLQGFGSKTKVAFEEAAQIACEAIQNIRTVTALAKEQVFLDQYFEKIKLPHAVAIKGALTSTFVFGFSQGVVFFIWSLSFYYGSRLVIWHINESGDVLKVLFAVIFAAMVRKSLFSQLM